jgi:predicted  nucleic acid-binding Zn-ribbon protein
LALKNKFNNEKDVLEKQFKSTEDEMTRAKEENDAKKDRIEILRNEHDAITKKLNLYRETTQKTIKE